MCKYCNSTGILLGKEAGPCGEANVRVCHCVPFELVPEKLKEIEKKYPY